MKLDEILRRLEEIESRAAKATPGPWEWMPYNTALRAGGAMVLAGGRDGIEVNNKNAEFIAHARTDIPWLCRTVRELLAQCAAMRQPPEEITSDAMKKEESHANEDT